MNSQRYSPEFKNEAVRQIVGRGYSVSVIPWEVQSDPIDPYSSDFVHLVYRLLKQDTYYDKIDLSLRANAPYYYFLQCHLRIGMAITVRHILRVRS